MNLKKICRGCFHEKSEVGGTCPYCGFDEIKYERERDPEVLPLNTVLQGKYVIGKCLGRGGFGITYIGWHANLQTIVAIKEFFPSGIVSRDTGTSDRATRSDVTMVNTGSTKAYRKSLDGFIKEARTLGGLRLPGVVLVHDFFEENRTAYIIMDYVEGENLSLWLKHSGGRLPEKRVLELVRPLTDSLQKLHEKGIIHRDISPDNLILQPDGSIMLVDFGAARTVVLEQEAEKAVQSMTVVLKPGYAPTEQYSSHGHQGPWTDVYALCATLFRMLTGTAPTDPVTRSVRDNDEEMLRTSLGSVSVSQGTINALMKGMQLRPQNRYQSMRELEEALYRAEEMGSKNQTDGNRTQQPHRGLIIAALVGTLVLIAIVIGFTVQSRNSKKQAKTESVSETETQSPSEKMSELESPEEPATASEAELQEKSERATEVQAQEAYEQGLAAYEAEDYEKAKEWYEKAAELGNASAMSGLGYMFHVGNGVKQDYGKAKEWYEKAADLGDVAAMYYLGFMYEKGNGVEQDYGKAKEWYEKAADLGNAAAMSVLGYMYHVGKGVEQDYGKAKAWYEKSADLGNAAAMSGLGYIYHAGEGVEQDYGKAKEWYEKAADLGNAAAMYYLGYMYENGTGVEQDYEKAKEWYEKAAALGSSEAQKKVESLLESSAAMVVETENANFDFAGFDNAAGI